MKIKIIGSGFSGLSVGILLLEKGIDVEIFTDRMPEDTSSSKAAAIWLPFALPQTSQSNLWSKQSHKKFQTLSLIPESGISMVPLTIYAKEEDAWWKNAIPNGEIRKATVEETVPSFPLGFTMTAPLAQTDIYLKFLSKKFQTLGGKITIKKITDIESLNSESNLIINCSGMGAKELFNDDSVYPIYGQFVKAQPQNNIHSRVVGFTLGEKEDNIIYVVPRKDSLILGGTLIKNKEEVTPNNTYTSEIIERCQTLSPNLKNIEIQSIEVGIRPGRSEIRLEREENIIHNYGHGGGGFTVSWGCAMSVLDLI